MVDIFLLYKFKLTLNTNFLQIALGTNPAEAQNFLLEYVLNFKVIVGVVLTVALIVAAIKYLREFFSTMQEKNLRRITYHSTIIFSPLIVYLCASIFIAVFVLALSSFADTVLGRNLIITKLVAERMRSSSDAEILAEMDRQNEKILVNNSKTPYVIFILGESTSRNHMQLYGYNLATTPKLVERNSRGEIFKFEDVIACANYTTAAMEKIFTFAEKEDDTDHWYFKANLFDILRRAGYFTVWISNQKPIGLWGNMDKIYPVRCDENFFANTKDYEPDEILFPIIDETLKTPHDKNFYVIHLYGTHAPYRERYPENFAKFTADDEDKPTEQGKKISAEYDNAVFYNDFIVDEIIKRFEDKDALIIYVPDHGQEVFENGSEFAGHSMEESGNRSMIEIPCIIWASETFRANNPQKISALENSLDNPYRTDLIIHAVLDLMDIQTENFDATKSILNEKFIPRDRIYNEQIYSRS